MKYVHRKIKPHHGQLIAMPHTLHIYGSDIDNFIIYSFQSLRSEVEEWCNDNLGDYLKEWNCDIRYENRIVFYFTSKNHAFAFKLRWT